MVVAAGLSGFEIGFQCFELSGVSSPSLVPVEPSTTGERVWYNWRNAQVAALCRGLFLIGF